MNCVVRVVNSQLTRLASKQTIACEFESHWMPMLVALCHNLA